MPEQPRHDPGSDFWEVVVKVGETLPAIFTLAYASHCLF